MRPLARCSATTLSPKRIRLLSQPCRAVPLRGDPSARWSATVERRGGLAPPRSVAVGSRAAAPVPAARLSYRVPVPCPTSARVTLRPQRRGQLHTSIMYGLSFDSFTRTIKKICLRAPHCHASRSRVSTEPRRAAQERQRARRRETAQTRSHNCVWRARTDTPDKRRGPPSKHALRRLLSAHLLLGLLLRLVDQAPLGQHGCERQWRTASVARRMTRHFHEGNAVFGHRCGCTHPLSSRGGSSCSWCS